MYGRGFTTGGRLAAGVADPAPPKRRTRMLLNIEVSLLRALPLRLHLGGNLLELVGRGVEGLVRWDGAAGLAQHVLQLVERGGAALTANGRNHHVNHKD